MIGDAIASGVADVLAGAGRLGRIRHAGMFIGVDVLDSKGTETDGRAARAVVNALRDENVLISASGSDGGTLKVRPPLVFTDGDVDRLLTAVDTVRRKGLFG